MGKTAGRPGKQLARAQPPEDGQCLRGGQRHIWGAGRSQRAWPGGRGWSSGVCVAVGWAPGDEGRVGGFLEQRPGYAEPKRIGQGCFQLRLRVSGAPPMGKRSSREACGSLYSALAASGTRLEMGGGEGAQAGLPMPIRRAAPRTRSRGAGPSSGQDPGLPWPQAGLGLREPPTRET